MIKSYLMAGKPEPVIISKFMEEEIILFNNLEEFRSWLARNYNKREVLWVKFYKVHTGKPSMRWEESVRQTLCFGWIDGLRKSIDEESYKIRFTPRKPGSHWSLKNIRMVEELKEEGKMKPPSLAAFNRRDETNIGQASFEQEEIKLKQEYLEEIKKNNKAYTFLKSWRPHTPKHPSIG
ncbi:MAG: hypothetical protein U5K69_22960 [Balneolaceae bacterium]|nr:hypothetical protein [Balneolaceae bacterium]